eukprot:UN25039
MQSAIAVLNHMGMNVFIRQYNTAPPSKPPTIAIFEIDESSGASLLKFGGRYVCANGFNAKAAFMACKMMGFLGGYVEIIDDEVGLEYSLSEINCPSNVATYLSCTLTMDQGCPLEKLVDITCFDDPISGGFIIESWGVKCEDNYVCSDGFDGTSA